MRGGLRPNAGRPRRRPRGRPRRRSRDEEGLQPEIQRPRLEEPEDSLIITTPNISNFSLTTFRAFQQFFPTTFGDLVKLTTSDIFNLGQALLGTRYNQLLPTVNSERLQMVTTEVGTMLQYISENGLPETDEWTNAINSFQTRVSDQNHRLPKLYRDYGDDEITQNGTPFCFELNPAYPDSMGQLSTILANYFDLPHCSRLLLMKLIQHPSVQMDFNNLNYGFRLCAGDQSAFISYCFEKAKAMLRGPLVCLPCATSFTHAADLKVHLKAKHINQLDMVAIVNRPEPAARERIRGMEAQLENARARENVLARQNQELLQRLTEYEETLRQHNLL